MKRIAIIFFLAVAAFSVALFFKVQENRAALLGPSGSSGIVEAVEVDVATRLPARIKSIAFEEGEAVKAGAVMVELVCDEQQAVLTAAEAKRDAARRQAEAAAAQANSALAGIDATVAQVGAAGAQKAALEASRGTSDRQVARLEKLGESGGATAVDLDRASMQATQLSEQVRALDSQIQAARGQARAARGQAEAARAQAEAAKIAILAAEADVLRAASLVAECTLRAPIDGVVAVRAFEPGEVLMPGARVLTLIQLDRVEVTFFVPNGELAAVEAGRAVTITADAYPNKKFTGKIAWVSPRAEFTPRNVQTREDRDRLVYAVRAVMANTSHELRPGMPVEVLVDGTARGEQ